MENQEIEEVAYITCNMCGEVIESGQEVEIDGGVYCDNCAHHSLEFFACYECEELHAPDNMYIRGDGGYVCHDCYDKHYFTCENCDEIYHIDSMVSTRDGECICEHCLNYSDNYARCDDCEEVVNIHNDDGVELHDGDYICESCYNHGDYSYCNVCGDYYHNDDMEYDENSEEYVCYNCYDECAQDEQRHSTELMNYSYKPQLRIYTTGEEKEPNLYIGFELETEQGDNGVSRFDLCKIIGNELNKNGTFVYFKQDGSLRCGVEVVSHAFTYEYYKQNIGKLKRLLQLLSENGYKSHDTSTCGLHVHINKKYFGETKQEQDENIDKLILFFEYFKDRIKTFSRRSNYIYCHFLSDQLGISDKKEICNIEKIKKHKSRERYLTVNVQNSNTVEIRVFKGTLKPESFFASLEFVFNLVRVVKHNAIDKITFSKVINFENSEYIKAYCKERNIAYDYDSMKDYSILYLREKKKVEKDATSYISKAYKLCQELVVITKKAHMAKITEIEKSLKEKRDITATDFSPLVCFEDLSISLKYEYYLLNYETTISERTPILRKLEVIESTLIDIENRIKRYSKRNSILYDLYTEKIKELIANMNNTRKKLERYS